MWDTIKIKNNQCGAELALQTYMNDAPLSSDVSNKIFAQ